MYSETCKGTGAEIGLSRAKAGCATPHLGFMATPFVLSETPAKSNLEEHDLGCSVKTPPICKLLYQ